MVSGKARRESRPGSGLTPSCKAAMGGTRVERSAGAKLANTVTVVPTTIETMTVRASTTMPVVGEIDSECLEELVEAWGNDQAQTKTDRGSTETKYHALSHDRIHDLVPGRPQGTKEPELSGPLSHGYREGIEDNECAHEEGDVGEDQQERLEEAEIGLKVGGLLSRLLRPGKHAYVGREHRLDSSGELVRSDRRTERRR